MIDRTSLWRFLSGRLLSLLALIGFQIVVVRLLPPFEYAHYALVLAFAALLQTATCFGMPRVVSKFLSGAAENLTPHAIRTLAWTLLGVRVAALLLSVALAATALGFIPSMAASWPMLLIGGAYALATAIQADGDGMAQALGLQIASRRAVAGEPIARLLLLITMSISGGGHDALTVLVLSTVTASLASFALIVSVLTSLRADHERGAARHDLDWREIRNVAFAGYGGALSWLALSPAVIRVIASRVLPLDVFAGFSFVQALTASVQRYTPSFTLFPMVEPIIMADAARTGRSDRLNTILSRLVTLDAVVIGAMIVGLSASGAPLIRFLTHGRYGEASIFLPWLLAAVVTNASHRRYEIAAIALGAGASLIASLGFTLAWLLAALLMAPAFGVWPLLLCPLGDALTRFWFMQRSLVTHGGPPTDVATVAVIIGAGTATSLAGAAIVLLLHANLLESLGLGAVSALVFLGFCVGSQFQAQIWRAFVQGRPTKWPA